MKIFGLQFGGRKPVPGNAGAESGERVPFDGAQGDSGGVSNSLPVYDGAPPPPPMEQETRPDGVTVRRPLPMSVSMTPGVGVGRVIYAMGFDGESNLGDMGPIMQYWIEYEALRWRSRQLYLENDLCNAIVTRSTRWVVGRELRLKADPQKEVLAMGGINIDGQKWSKQMEAWWRVYSNSKLADYAGQMTLQALTKEGRSLSKVDGDILVVLRIIDGIVKVQHIDAMAVETPPIFNIQYKEIPGRPGYDYVAPNGNRVRKGVEIDDRGQHIAYYVRKGVGVGLDAYERIPARGANTGMRFAYMVYSKRLKSDDTRGMPLLSVVMQRAKVLDRYLMAALGGAEERQKVAMFFEHGETSNQEDPIAGRRAKAFTGRGELAPMQADLPVDAAAEQKANDVAVSTGKTVMNLPNDVRIKAIESKQEVDVPGFATFHVDMICAACDIPPNVAMSKYEDSFSASRMAGKDWEHTFLCERDEFTTQYLQPIYELQLYVLVLTGQIEAPGYLEALKARKVMLANAYHFTRFAGDLFPDIDPLKTINFLRKAVGTSFDHVPMMPMEAAADALMQGDYNDLIEQAGDEMEKAKEAGFEPPPAPGASFDGAQDDKGKTENEGGEGVKKD